MELRSDIVKVCLHGLQFGLIIIIITVIEV